MPGVDEPAIFIDVTGSASRSMQTLDTQQASTTGRPGLSSRTLGIILADTVMALLVAVMCFGMFHPLREPGAGSIAIPAASVMLCTILCFFERGLYAASEVYSRTVSWKTIGIAWLQAVAAAALLLSFLAFAIGPATRVPMNPASVLRSLWLPAVLVAGIPAILAVRVIMACCLSPLHSPSSNRASSLNDQSAEAMMRQPG